MPSNQCCSCRLPEIPEQRPPSGTARYVLFRRFEFVGKEIFEVSATWRSFTAFKRATLRPRAARLRQARWAASFHKMRRCGSGAFIYPQQRREVERRRMSELGLCVARRQGMRIMTVAFAVGRPWCCVTWGHLQRTRRRPKSLVNHGKGLSSGCPW